MAKDFASQPMLMVEGHAKLNADPDLAVVNIVLRGDGADQAAAIREITASADSLKQALDERYIDIRRLYTVGIDLDTEVSPVQAVYTMRLEGALRQAWMDAVVEAANQVEASVELLLSFGLQDPASLQQRVLVKAIADARHSADALARAGDLQLGRVINVDYAEAQNIDAAVQSLTIPVPLTGELQLSHCGNMPVVFADKVRVSWSLDY